MIKKEGEIVSHLLLTCVDLTENQMAYLENHFPEIDIVPIDLFDKSDSKKVTIIYGWSDKLPAIDTLTSLKWIQTFSAGVNYLPLEELAKRDVSVTTTSGIHGHQMTESILGMLFSYTRNIRESILKQEKCEWGIQHKGTDLVGKRVLIFGTGSIAQQLAKVLVAFDCEVFGINRSGRQVENFNQTFTYQEAQEMLHTMDIVINLMPGTTETYHYFNDCLFSAMKKGVIFINLGRGTSVDTNDLIHHVQTENIAFAALDVFEEEPLPKDSELWKLKNVLITPHISGATDQYNDRAFAVFSDNLTKFMNHDKLKNMVDMALGY